MTVQSAKLKSEFNALEINFSEWLNQVAPQKYQILTPSQLIKKERSVVFQKIPKRKLLLIEDHLHSSELPLNFSLCIEVIAALDEAILMNDSQELFELFIQTWNKFLFNYAPIEVLVLYHVPIFFKEKQMTWIHLLVECFKNKEKRIDYLKILKAKVRNTLISQIAKIEKEHLLPVHQRPFFDWEALSPLFQNFPLKLLPSFHKKVAQVEKDIAAAMQVKISYIPAISELLSLPWDAVLDSSCELGKIVSHLYSGIWAYVFHCYADSWNTERVFPLFLHGLLQQLELLSTKEGKLTSGEVNAAYSQILTRSLGIEPKDVSAFYAQIVNIGGKRYFIGELLFEGLFKPKALFDKLEALTVWIYKKDFSIVSTEESFQHIYKKHKIGPYLSYSVVQQYISKLLEDLEPELKEDFLNLQSLAKTKEQVDLELISKLKIFYFKRFEWIRDKRKDYFRYSPIEIKDVWIDLAKFLTGMGYFPTFYHLLTPIDDEHDKEFTTLEPLEMFPPDYYIFSEKNELILVNQIRAYHSEHRLLGYRNHENKFRLLTEAEKKRLQHVRPQDLHYFENIKEIRETGALSLASFLEIKKMVFQSVYAEGLIDYKSYSEAQMMAADLAHINFYNYRQTLSPEEDEEIMSQLIEKDGDLLHFREVYEHMHEYKGPFQGRRRCLAEWGLYLAKLLLDYDDDLQFEANLTAIGKIDNLRQFSKKKIFKDHLSLNPLDLEKYLLKVSVSLMTTSFSPSVIPLVTEKCSLDKNNKNILTKKGKNLNSVLIKFLNASSDVRYVYGKVICRIFEMKEAGAWLSLLPCIKAEMEWANHLSGPHWSEDAFLHQTFEPEVIFLTLLGKLKSRAETSSSMADSLHKIFNLFSEQISRRHRWVQINIQLSHYLNTLSLKEKKILLSDLAQMPTPSKELFLEGIGNYVIHRVAWSLALSSRSFRFFNSEKISEKKYKARHGELKASIDFVSMENMMSLPVFLEYIGGELERSGWSVTGGLIPSVDLSKYGTPSS